MYKNFPNQIINVIGNIGVKMRYSLRNIVDSLPVKKNSNSSWWVKLWIRKVSFIFTFLFINLGFSSNAVSVLSIFITLSACLFYMLPIKGCVIAAIIMVNFWLILDCVDGNIARCRKVKTVYGEFVDDIGGYFTVAFIYLSIGVCAYNFGGVLLNPENHWIIIAGAISSVCDVLARLIHKDYCNFSMNLDENKNKSKKEFYGVADKHSINYIRRRLGKEIGISGLFMPLTVICAIVNAYDLMTLFYLVFNGSALVSTAMIYIYKADRYDKDNCKA